MLSFQRIEASLKIVTPYIVPATGKSINPPPLDVHRLLADKQMLGVLVQRLKDENKVEEKAEFERYLNGVLERRNALIHHFLSRDDANLDSEEKCRSVIQYLDEQHDFIQPMATLVEDYVKGLLFAVDLDDCTSSSVTVTDPADVGET